MTSPSSPKTARWAVAALGVALLYYGASRLSLPLALEQSNASPVWPASGVALAAVLWLGYRIWPGITLGACLANVEAFLRNQVADPGTILGASAAIGIGNTLEAVAGAWLLRRFAASDDLLGRAQNVFTFVAAALAMCAVSASIGPTVVSLAGFAPSASYATVWFTWWLGDVVGVLVVTPVLLAWCRQPKVTWMPWRSVEVVLLFAGLVLAGHLGFGGWPLPDGTHYALPFLPIPFFVWVAFRFGPREAATAAFVTAAIAGWHAAHERGPFVSTTVHGSLLLSQAFVGVVTTTVLVMAAAVAERAAVQATLRRARDEQESRVTERTHELLRLTEALRTEIAERNRAEEAIRQSEASFRLLFANNPQPMWVYDLETLQFLEVNEAAVAHYGYARAEFLRMQITDIRPTEERPRLLENVARERRDLEHAGQWKHRRRDGGIIDVEISSHTLEFSGRRAVLVVAADITERRQAEAALRTSEAQLRQAQKMEAVGQLAGGVAHDFNNLLTVIAGRSALLLQRVTESGAVRADIELISRTAERAAALTRQLLAFSRKQVLQPRVLDLNAVVEGLVKLLRRLIPESIDLVVHPGSALWPIKADPGQLEQILTNLVVNARDAMPQGGRLTIETGTVELDETFVRHHPGARVGPYVVLTVGDTGAGMDEATQQRIFEPFFTTKEPGKGTGLGLATVYGTVKQHEGYIALESAPGAGATFRIYLPRVYEDILAPPEDPRDGARLSRGSGVVLLVEDEADVGALAEDILRMNGYTVLAATGAREALVLAERNAGPIHILVTDVVMPHMSGKELADRLTQLRPGLKVLYMSGYTGDPIAHHGVLASKALLEKPFRPDTLARRVQEILNAP